MKLAVFGYTDKRIILLSLLKILQSKGEVLLMTSNKHFQRLIPGLEQIGHYQNSIIAVTNLGPEDVLPELGFVENDFEHLIYDCYDELPEDTDSTCYVLSDYVCEDEKNLLLSLNNFKTIYQCYGNKNAPRDIYTTSTKNLERMRKNKLKEDKVEDVVSSAIEIPQQHRKTKNNSFIVKPAYYKKIEEAESNHTSPIFNGKDLATAMHYIVGEELYLSIENIFNLLTRVNELEFQKKK